MSESIGAQLRKKKKDAVSELDAIQKYLDYPYITDKELRIYTESKEAIKKRISAISLELSEWEANR